MSNESEGSTDDDDEDYLPTGYTSLSIKLRSSNTSVSQSNDRLSSADDQTTRSQDSGKRKRVSWDLGDLDDSHDDGE